MRVVFMGTGDIAIPALRALLQSDFEVLCLVTQPDKPVGRKQILTAPLIKKVAEAFDIPVLQPEKVKSSLDQVEALAPDIIVVMAYGQILPLSLLEMPSCACINLHASLLPKHRGASCIQTAISEGDLKTGITVMHMTEALDEGDIILAHSTLIDEYETGGQLHDRLAELAPIAMLEALTELAADTASRTAQDDAMANYVPKLLRSDGEIDWTQPAEQIERLVRAYEPWPGTFTFFEDAKGRKKRLKVFAGGRVVEMTGEAGVIQSVGDTLVVACGDGAIELTEVQPEGGKRISAESFARSGVVSVDTLLG